MAFELKMPQLGLTMEEGTVSKWVKHEGDAVKTGEVILEITTDKLTNEVTSEVDGTLLKIVAQEGEQTGPEGCLSIPGKWGLVTRPAWVRVRAQDRDGNWFEAEGEGLTARCFCHELEHLDGHMYTEHIDHFLTDEELEEYFGEDEDA